jgi:type IX secretion system PorP/SprF family membrane protein
MMKISKCFIIILFLFSGIKVFAQDPQFSQFYANPLYLNPAFAGSNICPRLIMNYRNQWPSISGNFVTYNASYDQYFDAISGGLGLLVNNDREGEGTFSTTTANVLYAYSLEVSRSFSIKAGFQASYYMKKLDWSKLTFGDQIDPRYGFVLNTQEKPPDKLSKNTADFSAGLLGYSDKFYFGFAAHHLTEPNIGFYSQNKLPRKYTAHIGAIIPMSGGGARDESAPTISPNILFQKQQDFQQINFGMYFNKYPFVGGLWFRQSIGAIANPDAFIVLVGLETGVMRFGYSYDITVSKLTLASGGAHEFSFAFRFGCPPEKKKLKVINCPTF